MLKSWLCLTDFLSISPYVLLGSNKNIDEAKRPLDLGLNNKDKQKPYIHSIAV